MKKATLTVVMIAASLLVTACDDGHTAYDGYQLVWADEFATDGDPDPAKWAHESGHVRNQEAQYYLRQNARCSNGLLVIEARRERVPNAGHQAGSSDWKTRWKYARYTSASLTTKGLRSWTYGRFEMRARINARAGLWPAFWTVGAEGRWPACGEIDIMESYQGTLLANVFWQGANGKLAKHVRKKPLSGFDDPDWADRFHVWRMDWDEQAIRIYVDDELLNEFMLARADGPGGNPFHRPQALILNLAVGGTCGGRPAETRFPARLEVDYVRVYQRKESDG